MKDLTLDNSLQEKVILVDRFDQEMGLASKLEAHQKGLLHRAVSVFAIDSKGNWLMQKRADHKYHSAGLWSNTCCSHPLLGEKTGDAAKRRLQEEMGITADVVKIFDFIYSADLENNLIEHELDHVFIAYTDVEPVINPNEVSEWKRMSFEEIYCDITLHPENYSFWFKKIFERVQKAVCQSVSIKAKT